MIDPPRGAVGAISVLVYRMADGSYVLAAPRGSSAEVVSAPRAGEALETLLEQIRRPR